MAPELQICNAPSHKRRIEAPSHPHSIKYDASIATGVHNSVADQFRVSGTSEPTIMIEQLHCFDIAFSDGLQPPISDNPAHLFIHPVDAHAGEPQQKGKELYFVARPGTVEKFDG
ncbi:hypothetical protein NX059_001336 [Plenodomus lindquistii]|nr:hypothetical protein NX059_001336 [Plenodomus lindquistii]